MAMDSERLKQILELHKKWLDDEEGGERADLSWANLSEANLSKADLSKANLSEADLSKADLSWADLSWANLSKADLSEADLSEADLSEADLSWANLSKANLSEANLSWANLSEANLSWANLSEANLSWADLSWANLSEANLSEANLSEANLNWADLNWADVPEVPGLCKAILEAVEAEPKLFNMSTYHTETPCGTTHCMAGWAVHLAGEQGYALEKKIGPNAAGALIFAKSHGKVPYFYGSNDVALEWLRNNAEPEWPAEWRFRLAEVCNLMRQIESDKSNTEKETQQ